MHLPLPERYSLSQVAAVVDVSLSTPGRWVTIGVRGRKLRSFLIGGRRFVLRADLEEFLAIGGKEDQGQVAVLPVPSPNAVNDDSASRELNRRFGI